jgi:hypothetical protein
MSELVSGVPPEAVAAIREVYAATGGSGLAPAVLDAAADPASPLHRYFEWDDGEAAQQYRLAQAEALVRRVRVTLIPAEGGPPIKVRAFVATRELREAAEALGDTGVAEAPRGSYMAIEQVAGQTAYEQATVEAIRRDLSRLAVKYRAHAALFRETFDDLFGDTAA